MPHMFVPGPVDVESDVLQAQAQPMIPHRSAEFEEIFHRAEGNLRKLFFTQNRVFITASSGTGLQETAVRNFVPDNGRILSCVNGAFGSRWYDVAVSNGKTVDKLETEWQKPVTADLVTEALKKAYYDIVTIVHNETSTGLMNPIQQVAAAVHQVSPETLVCVDAVSGLAGAKVETDAWGLDFVLTSAQKCLALPPGLGFAATSDRALARAEQVTNRGWYFDLLRLEKHRKKDSTPATPAVSLIYALDVQMKHILTEGLENRFARHTAMAKRVHAWAEAHDMNIFAPKGYRSRTVTTITNDLNIDLSKLNTFLLERGMRIAGGYGPLKGKTFRIAHMGETRLEHLEELFAAMEAFMA